MICPKCGKEIEKGARFCKYCGTSMQTEEKGKSNLNEKRVCPVCGAINKEENLYCINCGTGMDSFLTQKRAQQIPQRRNKKPLLVCVGIIAGILLAVGIVGGISFREKRQSELIERSEVAEEKTVEEKGDTEIHVEKEMEPIVKAVEEIREGISFGKYEENIVHEGLTIYYEDSEPQAMITSGDDEYGSREYYFKQNQLIYAEFRGEDNQYLYFKNERLLCWDSEISGKTKRVTKYDDLDETSEFFIWEADTLESVDALFISASPAGENSDFILEESDRRLLSKDEVANLTQEELKLARNEIYARHGYDFADEYLKRYFEQFEWYQPTIAPEDFQETMLNEFEIYNRDLIVEYETEQGYR